MLALNLIVVLPAANASWTETGDLKTDRIYHTATLLPDGTSVTLELTDGGFGDADGVENGIIVDPSGLAGTTTTPEPTPQPRGDGGGGGVGGCSIDVLIE